MTKCFPNTCYFINYLIACDDAPPSVPFSNHNHTDTVNAITGNVVLFTCIRDGSTVMSVCQQDGTWSQPDGNCAEPATCKYWNLNK